MPRRACRYITCIDFFNQDNLNTSPEFGSSPRASDGSQHVKPLVLLLTSLRSWRASISSYYESKEIEGAPVFAHTLVHNNNHY